MNAFRLLACAGALAFACAATAAGPGKTAKADAGAAIAVARQWRADAVLTGIATFAANADGTASQWTYQFHSHAANQGLSVAWQGGKPVSQVMSADATMPLGEFIDSDRAIAAAAKHGLRSKGKVPMTLRALGGGASEAVYWTIGTAFHSGDVAVVLAAQDGALITTHGG